jgi:hypothetical protein
VVFCLCGCASGSAPSWELKMLNLELWPCWRPLCTCVEGYERLFGKNKKKCLVHSHRHMIKFKTLDIENVGLKHI